MDWFQQNGTEEIDEHAAPTEPLPENDVSSFVLGLANGEASADEPTLPISAPNEQPFPQQYEYYPASQQALPYSPQPPQGNTYPYFPPAPIEQQKKKRRERADAESFDPTGTNKPASPVVVKRHVVPVVVGLCFVAVQLLLLIRFVLSTLDFITMQPLGPVIYVLSEVFVWPFQTFWQQVPLQLPARVELYTLLAVVVYGLVSRILVHLVKGVLKSVKN